MSRRQELATGIARLSELHPRIDDGEETVNDHVRRDDEGGRDEDRAYI